METKRAHLVALVAAAVVGLVVAACAGAASPATKQAKFPDQPVQILVPRTPGGGLDLMSRVLAPELSKELGVAVPVVNVPAGGGVEALAKVYGAPADGLMVVNWSPPGEYIKEVQELLPGFKASDFEVLAGQNSDPGMIAVRADSPIKTMKDFIAAAQSRQLIGVTSPTATHDALLNALIQKEFNIKLQLVPFAGGSDFTAALLGGNGDFSVRSGGWYGLHPSKLRILAVSSTQRVAELPDVPTLKEATGVEIIHAAVRGYAVRKGLPAERLTRLREAFEKVIRSPTVEQGMKSTDFRYEAQDWKSFDSMQQLMVKRVDQYKELFPKQ